MNGWLRLWVVLSVFCFIASAGFAYVSMPAVETINHEKSFESKLSSEALAQQAQDNDATATLVTMPNGHVLALKAEFEAKKSTTLLAEYAALLERKATEQKQKHLINYGLSWLFSSLAVLLLGFAVVWVRNGFVSSKKIP